MPETNSTHLARAAYDLSIQSSAMWAFLANSQNCPIKPRDLEKIYELIQRTQGLAIQAGGRRE